jgi:hypothetical protein
MLTKRDKEIIDNLKRFRVMDRDSISEIHFKGLKNPKDSTNNVLLRLIRDGHIQRSTAFVPYVYFTNETNMKKNSQKIGHFLAILNVYREMLNHGTFTQFIVEPKYGNKGMAEPDVFCLFKRNGKEKNAPFFIEVQNSYFSEKQINEKLDRYQELYDSKIVHNEGWQPKGKQVFPVVLILSEQRYAIEKRYPFKVFQSPTFTSLHESLLADTESKPVYKNATQTNLKMKTQGGI